MPFPPPSHGSRSPLRTPWATQDDNEPLPRVAHSPPRRFGAAHPPSPSLRAAQTVGAAAAGRSQLDQLMRSAACARALESARSDALFIDKFAARLAGQTAMEYRQNRRRRDFALDGMPSVADRLTDPFAPSVLELVALRTRWIDERIIEWCSSPRVINPVVVIVGAALDSRAWRLPSLGSATVIEVDSAGALAAKAAILDEDEVAAPLLCRRRIPVACDSDGASSDVGQLARVLRANATQSTPLLWEERCANALDESVPGTLDGSGAGDVLWIVEGLCGLLSERENASLFTAITRLSNRTASAQCIATFNGGSGRFLTDCHRFSIPMESLDSKMMEWGIVPTRIDSIGKVARAYERTHHFIQREPEQRCDALYDDTSYVFISGAVPNEFWLKARAAEATLDALAERRLLAQGSGQRRAPLEVGAAAHLVASSRLGSGAYGPSKKHPPRTSSATSSSRDASSRDALGGAMHKGGASRFPAEASLSVHVSRDGAITIESARASSPLEPRRRSPSPATSPSRVLASAPLLPPPSESSSPELTDAFEFDVQRYAAEFEQFASRAKLRIAYPAPGVDGVVSMAAESATPPAAIRIEQRRLGGLLAAAEVTPLEDTSPRKAAASAALVARLSMQRSALDCAQEEIDSAGVLDVFRQEQEDERTRQRGVVHAFKELQEQHVREHAFVDSSPLITHIQTQPSPPQDYAHTDTTHTQMQEQQRRRFVESLPLNTHTQMPRSALPRTYGAVAPVSSALGSTDVMRAAEFRQQQQQQEETLVEESEEEEPAAMASAVAGVHINRHGSIDISRFGSALGGAAAAAHDSEPDEGGRFYFTRTPIPAEDAVSMVSRPEQFGAASESLLEHTFPTMRPEAGSIRVGISSLGIMEPFAPPYNVTNAVVMENVKRAMDIIAAAAASGASLVLLPEVFHVAGIDFGSGAAGAAVAYAAAEPPLRLGSAAEQCSGANVVKRICDAAALHSVHIIFGLLARAQEEGVGVSAFGALYNRAVVVDNNGAVVGSYCKAFPTEGELALGVRPGVGIENFQKKNSSEYDSLDSLTVTTSLGVLGLAICFDLNFPQLWSAMKERGAQVAVWLSAYPGGLPLRIRALESELPIVTSVQGIRAARYVDAAGRVRTTTSRWQRMAFADVNLHQRLVHTDGSHALPPPGAGLPRDGSDATIGRGVVDGVLRLQRALGRSVTVSTLDEEHLALIEFHGESTESKRRPQAQSGDDYVTRLRDSFTGLRLSVDDAIASFGLRPYRAYIDRCTVAVRNARIGS